MASMTFVEGGGPGARAGVGHDEDDDDDDNHNDYYDNDDDDYM